MRFAKYFLLIVALALFTSCTPADKSNGDKDSGNKDKKKKIKVAFVTNGIAHFWTYGKAGANAAADELGIDLEVKMPPSEGGRASNQKRMVEQLLSNKVDGIAISPAEPENQGSLLKQISEKAALITHDSDAPDSERSVFIGISNYKGGREVGKLVKKAIPDGGNVVIFIGSVGQNNGKLRRQGTIDELLDRSEDETRFDKPGKAIVGDKYTILETKIDDFDDARKKELPQQALAKHGDKIDCMVGLFEYNPPFIFDALKSKGKLGKVAVVGFDENFRTLDEIAAGNCVGTVVQNPYEYGYRSVMVLHDIITGKNDYKDKDYIEIPLRVITTKERAEEYKKELQQLLKKAKN